MTRGALVSTACTYHVCTPLILHLPIVCVAVIQHLIMYMLCSFDLRVNVSHLKHASYTSPH